MGQRIVCGMTDVPQRHRAVVRQVSSGRPGITPSSTVCSCLSDSRYMRVREVVEQVWACRLVSRSSRYTATMHASGRHRLVAELLALVLRGLADAGLAYTRCVRSLSSDEHNRDTSSWQCPLPCCSYLSWSQVGVASSTHRGHTDQSIKGWHVVGGAGQRHHPPDTG